MDELTPEEREAVELFTRHFLQFLPYERQAVVLKELFESLAFYMETEKS